MIHDTYFKNCQEFLRNLLFVKTEDSLGTLSRLALVFVNSVSLTIFAEISIKIAWEYSYRMSERSSGLRRCKFLSHWPGGFKWPDEVMCE